MGSYDYLEYFSETLTTSVSRWSLIINIVFVVVGFFFKAFGLYTMAKRKGLDKKWLCFIPFGNFIIMGELVGVTYVFRNRVKNLGIIICVLLASSAVISLFTNLYTIVNSISLIIFGKTGVIVLGGFLRTIYEWTGVVSFYISIVQIIVNIMGIVFEYFLLRALFIKYDRKNGNLYSIIAILGYIFDIDILAGIFVFVCRNKVPVDFNQFQARRVNVYTYNNGNNGSSNVNNNTSSYNDDPFPEFGSNDQNNNYKTNDEDKKVDDDLFD